MANRDKDWPTPDVSDEIRETLEKPKGIPRGIGQYTMSDIEYLDFFGKDDPSPLEDSVDRDGHSILESFKEKSVFMLKSQDWTVVFRLDDCDVTRVKDDEDKTKLPFGHPKAYFTPIQYLCDIGITRQRIAVKKDWNELGRLTILFIPPGFVFFEGQAAPQGNREDGTWLRGGARQIYIPKYARELLQNFTVQALKDLHLLDAFLKNPPKTEWDYNFIDKLKNVLASNRRLSNQFDSMMCELLKTQRDVIQGWYAKTLAKKRVLEIMNMHCFGHYQEAPFGSETYRNICPVQVQALLESGRDSVNMVRTCHFEVKTPLGVYSYTIRIFHPYVTYNTASGRVITGG